MMNDKPYNVELLSELQKKYGFKLIDNTNMIEDGIHYKVCTWQNTVEEVCNMNPDALIYIYEPALPIVRGIIRRVQEDPDPIRINTGPLAAEAVADYLADHGVSQEHIDNVKHILNGV